MRFMGYRALMMSFVQLIEVAIVFLAASFLESCTTFDMNVVESVHEPFKGYPQSELGDLDEQELAEYNRLLRTAPEPSTIPYPSGSTMSALYVDWFKKGYAFGKLIKVRHLRGQTRVMDDERRVILAGWYKGNGVALLEVENSMIRGTMVNHGQALTSDILPKALQSGR